MSKSPNTPRASTRRPPRYRSLEVIGTEPRSAHLVRLTLGGPELAGFPEPALAASVRLLLPDPGASSLRLPTWDGNKMVHPDGDRPVIRTVTPLDFDAEAEELSVEVVLHHDSPLTMWAATAEAGSPVAVSEPARGYTPVPEAGKFLLCGDESALPAIGQLVDELPAEAELHALVEVARSDARIDLGERPDMSVTWLDTASDAPPGEALVEAVRQSRIADATWVWAAGEAKAMHQIRTYLLRELELPRERAAARGYWKHGRAGSV